MELNDSDIQSVAVNRDWIIYFNKLSGDQKINI